MAETLTTLRDKIETILADSTNTRFSTATIDQALRQALGHYSASLPAEGLLSHTLTATGREIDLSAVLADVTIKRVWWDYDSSDPLHPPEWRSFEQWPSDILYVNDPDEPQTGDVVRVWYQTAHTLSGLDSATATTFPDAHSTYLAIGAAGYAAQTRAIDRTEILNIDGWTHKRLSEWADQRLAQFARALKYLASQKAARASGIVEGPPLDRWDNNKW